jgi:hypothetical protein
VGCPFTTWSLSKLGEHLTARHRVVISTETVRTIPRDAGISWQATRTWKASKDPEFVAKMARILQLYDRALADGRVICVDECQQRHRRMPRVMAAGWHPPMVVIRPTVNPSGARSLLSRSTVCRATHGPAPATAVVVAVAEGSWQAAGRGRGPGR